MSAHLLFDRRRPVTPSSQANAVDHSLNSAFASKERIMAASADKDLAEHLETIRADIASLTKSVSQLATDTAGIQANLRQRVRNAAKSAVGAGEEILNEAEKLGGEAMHAA